MSMHSNCKSTNIRLPVHCKIQAEIEIYTSTHIHICKGFLFVM